MCLPQFAKRGPLQQHGFARNVSWELVDGSSDAGVHLRLDVTDALRAEYNFDGRFVANVHVCGMGSHKQHTHTHARTHPPTHRCR